MRAWSSPCSVPGRATPATSSATCQRPDAVSRMALLERILEEILMWEIRRILTGYPFTIGIIIAYFVLKRSEIRRIMTVLNAKFYALPEERIEAVL